MSAAQARQQDESTESGETFSNRPAFSAKPIPGISVSNWKNRTTDGEFTTTAVETSWKDKGSDEYQKRKISVTFDQLPHLIMSLQEAYRAQLLERSQQQVQSRAR